MGRLRALEAGVVSLDMRSKTNMTACRKVAAAVEDTTETRESCSLKHNNRAWGSARSFSLLAYIPKNLAVDIGIVGQDGQKNLECL